MALFKFRKGGDDDSLATSHPAESVEMMRRRAKHRLIGAAVLVLVGVVGFPLLFDTQPRPIPVDIPIDIPDRAKTRPLATPAAAPASQAPVVAAVTPPAAVAPAPAPAAAAKVAASASLSPKEEFVAAKAEPKPAPVKAEPKPEPKPVAKVEPKPEPKPVAKPDDGARAKALLEGKAAAAAAPAPAAVEGRFVVQVGAFADADKARDTRLKVEKAGLKTYTHVAETKEGKRTRVRVGPFTSRAEADKAAEKIKALDLPASILTL